MFLNMTKYPVICNSCGYQFDVDEPPSPDSKPRQKTEDLEPSGTLKTTTGQNSKCPNCNKIGARPLF